MVNKVIREKIIAKQNKKCANCPNELRPNSTHVDHIEPKFRGGTDDEYNLQALCANCHSEKSNLENKQRAVINKRDKELKLPSGESLTGFKDRFNNTF